MRILLQLFPKTRIFKVKPISLLMGRNYVVLEQIPLAFVEYADIMHEQVVN